MELAMLVLSSCRRAAGQLIGPALLLAQPD